MMETYLLMLYVTVEQELAIQRLYYHQGWLYRKVTQGFLESAQYKKDTRDYKEGEGSSHGSSDDDQDEDQDLNELNLPDRGQDFTGLGRGVLNNDLHMYKHCQPDFSTSNVTPIYQPSVVEEIIVPDAQKDREDVDVLEKDKEESIEDGDEDSETEDEDEEVVQSSHFAPNELEQQFDRDHINNILRKNFEFQRTNTENRGIEENASAHCNEIKESVSVLGQIVEETHDLGGKHEREYEESKEDTDISNDTSDYTSAYDVSTDDPGNAEDQRHDGTCEQNIAEKNVEYNRDNEIKRCHSPDCEQFRSFSESEHGYISEHSLVPEAMVRRENEKFERSSIAGSDQENKHLELSTIKLSDLEEISASETAGTNTAGGKHGYREGESSSKMQHSKRRKCKKKDKMAALKRTKKKKIEVEKLHNESDSKPKHCCGICNKTFVAKHVLVLHMMTHDNERPHKCTMCDKAFNRKDYLEQHMRIHSGNKPYQCTKCNKAFTQQGSLIKHLRFHSGEKPFLCTECGNRFSEAGSLYRHLRTHTGEKPFSCTYCQKGFTANKDRQVHERIHTGERPYKCTVCEKAFIKNYDLRRHMRKHTGEKPYRCRLCERGFSQHGNMLTHLKTHSGQRNKVQTPNLETE